MSKQSYTTAKIYKENSRGIRRYLKAQTQPPSFNFMVNEAVAVWLRQWGKTNPTSK